MDINSIQHIIDEFLKIWQSQDGYLGTLLTGSFASNTADEGSDIDLRIIYNKESRFHEFGDITIAGKSVSFVGMSSQFFEQTFESDLNSTSKFEIRRFAVGKIIDDNNGEVKALQSKATALLNTKTVGIDEGELLQEKLMIGRQFRVFMEMPTTDLCFKMAYYDLLKTIFEFYTQATQADIPIFIKKWSRFLTNEVYRTANFYTAFPDQQFVKLLINCFEKEEVEHIKALYNYVMTETGDIQESNFFVRFHEDTGEIELYGLE